MVSVEDLDETYVPRARLEKLPAKFTGRVLRIEEREDSNYPGYSALYMDIAVEDPKAAEQAEGELLTQKLRGMHIHELLIPAMQKLGITDTDELVGKLFTFEQKMPSFEGSNPRWVPVATPDGKRRRRKRAN
ncbi:hypothetical protein J7J62_04880 [bacterium]|nr:hypothetical protein [bacterium]